MRILYDSGYVTDSIKRDVMACIFMARCVLRARGPADCRTFWMLDVLWLKSYQV